MVVAPFWIVGDRVARISGKDERHRCIVEVRTSPATMQSPVVSCRLAWVKQNSGQTHHEPTQKEDASFISSQIPENSTPDLDQLLSASVHNESTFLANQPGKTCVVQAVV